MWRFAEPLPADIEPGLREIARAFPERFAEASEPLNLHFRRDETHPRRWRAERHGPEAVIHYSRPGDAFRALGSLMGEAIEKSPLPAREEACAMERLGVMIDASRNGVPTVSTVCALIRSFALLGINWLMLYTEDTYEVPGEPLFGYFRGRYSAAELGEIDRYAARFGMEVIPCIQTLGHLGQLLRWPAYAGLRDTAEVLLAENDATYKLVEKMLAAANAPFRSRRIHIGMDEADGIGTGRYRLLNGVRTPFQILASHLTTVAESCRRLDLQPMIWSDMYFRLGSKANHYYDRDSSIPQEIGDAIPDNIDLVYWDYYHLDESFYEEWIRRHRALGKEPLFAAGIWSWSRFWTALPHTFATLDAGMRAACRAGVREAFATVWGTMGWSAISFPFSPAWPVSRTWPMDGLTPRRFRFAERRASIWTIGLRAAASIGCPASAAMNARAAISASGCSGPIRSSISSAAISLRMPSNITRISQLASARSRPASPPRAGSHFPHWWLKRSR